VATATHLLTDKEATARPPVEAVVVRFAGDSGDGMQLTGGQFTLSTALAGWAGDTRVSDNQFVIAAYQASQIYGIGINAQNWALTFGGDQMRDIDDQRVRRNLAVVLTADYEPVGFNAVATPYREHVRQIIPSSIQDQIRASCGDRNMTREGAQYIVVLPPECPLQLNRVEAAKVAAALRAHRELVPELNWHLAAIANYLTNVDGLEGAFRALDASLKNRS
jgi:hypothetical protein